VVTAAAILYVFRKTAENPAAVAAYRKFLSGQILVKGPVTSTIVDRVQQKMARVQSELPGWVQRNGRHVTVKQLTDALTAVMETGNPVRWRQQKTIYLRL